MAIGTPTAITSSTNFSWGASGTSFTMALTASVVAGNLAVLVIGANTSNSCTVSSVSDGTNSYSKAVNLSIAGPTDVEIWYFQNTQAVASGSITVTYNTAPGGGVSVAQAFQVSGVHLTSALDKTATASGGAVASLSMNTAALAAGGEIAIGIGCGVATGGQTYSGASGFTNLGSINTNPFPSGWDYQQQGSTSTTAVTYAPSWSSAVTFRADGVVATFRQATIVLSATDGSFSETGEVTPLTPTLTAVKASFTETGEGATLLPLTIMSAAVGTFAEAAENAPLSILFSQSDGSFAMSGESITVLETLHTLYGSLTYTFEPLVHYSIVDTMLYMQMPVNAVMAGNQRHENVRSISPLMKYD